VTELLIDLVEALWHARVVVVRQIVGARRHALLRVAHKLRGVIRDEVEGVDHIGVL